MSDESTTADEKRTKHENKRHVETAREELRQVDQNVESPWTNEQVEEAMEATERAHQQMTDEVESEDI